MLRWTGWLLAAGAVALQLFALYRPSGPPSDLEVPGLDKVAHLIIFGLPVFLILLALNKSSVRSLSLSKGIVIIFATHAVISEIIQGVFYRHRTGDPFDVVADLVGVALGVAAYILVDRRWMARPSESEPDRVVAP